MTPPPDAILRFAAAIPLILLGLVLLLLRPRRPPQVFFSLFAIAWGLQGAVMNIGLLLDDADLHHRLFLLGAHVNTLTVLFLIHFSVLISGRPHAWIGTMVTAGLVVAANVVLFFRPELVVEEIVRIPEIGLVPVVGPLAFLVRAPFWIALFVGLLAVYDAYRRAKPGTPRRRLRGLLMAFALFSAYNYTSLMLGYLDPSRWQGLGFTTMSGVNNLIDLVLWTAGSLAYVAIVTHLVLRPPAREGRDGPLLAAFLVPMTVAALEYGLGAIGFEMKTPGFWRILAVAVIVYTLANHQLFEMELRVKKYAPLAAAGLMLVGMPAIFTVALGEFGARPFLFGLIPQVLGVAGVVMFQKQIKDALFPGVAETPDYLHQRKLDIYRVALEEAALAGRSLEGPALAELRVRNGITDQEHAIIAWMVAAQKGKTTSGDAGAFEVGRTVLDHYRLKRLIGKGSYGRTFLAFDNRTRREVALKTVGKDKIDGTAADLLLREAQLAASLDHPYVLDILDVANLGDRVVVVMEYANNGNLDDYLERKGRLPLEDASRFLHQLLLALEEVHTKGIVHRNLKPKNILIEDDGSVRLSDFGAAQSTRLKGTERTEFAAGALQEILYQAPEQIGRGTATARSDLYVAAVLFHEALTRRYPFPISGKDDHRIREVLRAGTLRLQVDGHPSWVAGFLNRALATDPQDRYPSAAEMRADLERYMDAADP